MTHEARGTLISLDPFKISHGLISIDDFCLAR